MHVTAAIRSVRRAVVAGAAAAAVLAAPAGAVPAPADPGAASPFYVAPAGGSTAPGAVLRRAALPRALWLPGTGRAWRVLYRSTGWRGRPVAVSGAVFVPAGRAPRGGWPVINWSHGTVGIANRCAPSFAGRSERDVTYLSGWLKAGYAIAATDYEGLGTPGPHPYLEGRGQASASIDMVRAARTVAPSLGRAWVEVGQSQGGQAALFTAMAATKRAPELRYLGAVATAPPSYWRVQLGAALTDSIRAALTPLVVRGLQVVEPRIDPADFLTADGLALLPVADTGCTKELVDAVLPLVGRRLLSGDPRSSSLLMGAINRHLEIPAAKLDRPLFVGQGQKDQIVVPAATDLLVAKLRRAGSRVRFDRYPDADHNGALTSSAAPVKPWVAALFRAAARRG